MFFFTKLTETISPIILYKSAKIIGIIFGSFLLSWCSQRILKIFFRKIQARISVQGFQEKTETVRSLLKSLIGFSIFIIAVVMVLVELGINIGPLLAGAGVIGFAVGFGSQTLVKDLVSGMFLILEDQFNLGDKIEILGVVGRVWKVGLRTTILKDQEGNFHYISNSQINRVKKITKNSGS